MRSTGNHNDDEKSGHMTSHTNHTEWLMSWRMKRTGAFLSLFKAVEEQNRKSKVEDERYEQMLPQLKSLSGTLERHVEPHQLLLIITR